MARKVSTLNRWEPITTKAWATNTTLRFTRDADFDQSRYLRAIMLNVRGTAVLAGADATAILADGYASIIQAFLMSGKNRRRSTNDNSFVSLRGADLYELQSELQGVSLFDASTTLAKTQATYNLDFTLIYEFPPQGLGLAEKVGYLFDMPNWSNYTLELDFGDEKDIWNPAGLSTFTWSAQTVNLLGMYAQESGKFDGFSMGLKYLNYFDSTADLTTSANAVQLQQLDNKAKISRLMLKTGVKSTTVTAGHFAYASLSDAILANVKVLDFPTKLYKQFYRYRDIKVANSYAYRRSPSLGYGIVDFIGDGLSFSALDPAAIAVGPGKTTNLWLQADVTGAANQNLTTAQESLYYADQIVIPK